MAIVSEKNISTALTYLADDPHPVALWRHKYENAENERKRIYAGAYLEATGTVAEREATAETNPEHVKARATEAFALFELERHRQRMKAAEMLIEVWRSENANIRAAERVR